jgi:hypothetical protein
VKPATGTPTTKSAATTPARRRMRVEELLGESAW